MDFEQELNQILSVIPKERQTMLFSATMTSKVKKLQRASLHNPVKVRPAHSAPHTGAQMLLNLAVPPSAPPGTSETKQPQKLAHCCL